MSCEVHMPINVKILSSGMRFLAVRSIRTNILEPLTSGQKFEKHTCLKHWYEPARLHGPRRS